MITKGKTGRLRQAALAGVLIFGGLTAFSGGVAAAETSISVKKESVSRGSRGGLFSMEFRDADVKDVLRAIGQENNLNIVIAEDVEGRLTLSFFRVTLGEAFEAILKVNNLMSLEEGNIIRVFKSPFADGEGNMVTRIIPIQFTDVKETEMTIKNLLSKQGALSVDIRTNTLIVRDVPDNVEKIQAILKKLDTQTPQVLIEARIVEAATNFTREMGVQWGGNFQETTQEASYRVTGAARQLDTSDTARPLTGGLGLSGNNFAVNLPANVAEGRGGALGFSFGKLNNTVQLDLQLSAMEDTGNGKVLSNPRILALDNREAKISAGTEILIPVTTITTGVTTGATGTTSGGTTGAAGTTTAGVTTINAKLELTVTPHVTSEGMIVMKVKADRKEPDFTRQVQNIPPLITRTAETNLLVKNSETIVIGGIYTRNESFSEKGVPWFSKIPILGWFFKKQSRRDDQNELLIFITPTIIGKTD